MAAANTSPAQSSAPEMVFTMGLPGAGKSTVFRVLARLIRTDSSPS